MVKPQPSDQRIGVFVDVQNLYYSAKYLYSAKVDFGALLQTVTGKRTLIRAIAYGIRVEDHNDTFFDALRHIGYEVKAKDLQVFQSGAKKGDWDIGIAMDMIQMASKLDTVVLCSGDGDFVPLVKHLQAHGCRVEVASFGKSSASKLFDECDSYTDLDKGAKNFLILSTRRRPEDGRNSQ